MNFKLKLYQDNMTLIYFFVKIMSK